MLHLRNRDRKRSEAIVTGADRIEYLVRSSGEIWLIEHDGDKFGPYKNRHEAMYFAVDAAHRLGMLGKNTRVRLTDQGGRPLSTWTYGLDPFPPFF